jgi:hypothetical protein
MPTKRYELALLLLILGLGFIGMACGYMWTRRILLCAGSVGLAAILLVLWLVVRRAPAKAR